MESWNRDSAKVAAFSQRPSARDGQQEPFVLLAVESRLQTLEPCVAPEPGNTRQPLP